MKDPKKKKRGSRKDSVNVQTKIGAMDHFKYDSKPGVIMSTKTDKEGMADRELRRMVKSDVFRSAKETVSKTNSNKRRYQ